jgi:hypothetical protein
MAQKQERAMDGAPGVAQKESKIARVVVSHPWYNNKNVPRMGRPAAALLQTNMFREELSGRIRFQHR